jgi:hypothetical protein
MKMVRVKEEVIVKDHWLKGERRDHEVCVEKKKSGDYLSVSRKEDLKKKRKSLGKSYPQY